MITFSYRLENSAIEITAQIVWDSEQSNFGFQILIE